MSEEPNDDRVVPFRKREKEEKKGKGLPQPPQFVEARNVRFEVGSDGKLRITSLVEAGSKEEKEWANQLRILEHLLRAQSIPCEVFLHQDRKINIKVPDTLVLDLSPLRSVPQ